MKNESRIIDWFKIDVIKSFSQIEGLSNNLLVQLIDENNLKRLKESCTSNEFFPRSVKHTMENMVILEAKKDYFNDLIDFINSFLKTEDSSISLKDIYQELVVISQNKKDIEFYFTRYKNNKLNKITFNENLKNYFMHPIEDKREDNLHKLILEKLNNYNLHTPDLESISKDNLLFIDSFIFNHLKNINFVFLRFLNRLLNNQLVLKLNMSETIFNDMIKLYNFFINKDIDNFINQISNIKLKLKKLNVFEQYVFYNWVYSFATILFERNEFYYASYLYNLIYESIYLNYLNYFSLEIFKDYLFNEAQLIVGNNGKITVWQINDIQFTSDMTHFNFINLYGHRYLLNEYNLLSKTKLIIEYEKYIHSINQSKFELNILPKIKKLSVGVDILSQKFKDLLLRYGENNIEDYAHKLRQILELIMIEKLYIYFTNFESDKNRYINSRGTKDYISCIREFQYILRKSKSYNLNQKDITALNSIIDGSKYLKSEINPFSHGSLENLKIDIKLFGLTQILIDINDKIDSLLFKKCNKLGINSK